MQKLLYFTKLLLTEMCYQSVFAEEKRKLFAEQRDNAVAHPKEVVSVSVRAISALYMSKVATQDSARKLSKPVIN